MEYKITCREKDGGWQYIISIKSNTGKWKQATSKQGFDKKKTAKAAADTKLDELKEKWGLQISKDYEGITFGDFAEMHIKHLKLHREYSTINNYKFASVKFADIEDLEIGKVTSLHIQNCVDGMVREGLNSATITEYTRKIKALFSNAMDPHKIIAKNPVIKIRIPEEKEQEKLKALTKSELDILLGKIKCRKYYIASILAANCGLRLGEVAGATWSNIDELNKTLKIDKQWKLGKDGKFGFGTLKSKNSYRVVPIPSSALKELLRYKKDKPIDYLNRIVPYSRTGNLSKVLKAAYVDAGYDISIHDLRHTYATILISNGVDFKTAAQLLGHNIEQTMQTYSHVTSDMLDRATHTLNNIF